MSITLSATITETRLGKGAGGIMNLHCSSYQQQKDRTQPLTGRKLSTSSSL